MKDIKNGIRKVIAVSMEAIFPSRCVGCHAVGSFLCDTCRMNIPPAEKPAHGDTRAAWSYRHPSVRRLIWHIKYEGVRAAAPVCAAALADMILEDLAERHLFERSKTVLIIPIPLSRARLRERGYNQTEDIARAVMTLLPDTDLILTTHALEKVRDTTPQMSLANKAERLRNLHGAFTAPDSSQLAGRDVILIDDVTTTGATFAEARKVLKEAGACNILCYAVAH